MRTTMKMRTEVTMGDGGLPCAVTVSIENPSEELLLAFPLYDQYGWCGWCEEAREGVEAPEFGPNTFVGTNPREILGHLRDLKAAGVVMDVEGMLFESYLRSL